MGAQDPWRPIAGRPTGRLPSVPLERPADHCDGPLLSFLQNADPFDVLYLLHDPNLIKTGAFRATKRAIAALGTSLTLNPRLVPVTDPRAYEALYRHMRAECERALAKHGSAAEYNVLVSPG